MAGEQQSKPQPSNSGKVGSDPDAAKRFGGKGDFGAHEADTAERNYVSENTRQSDPGAAQPYSGDGDAGRTAGVGGNASGVGASSGGDLDPDIIGLGSGGGIAQNPPRGTAGPDDSDGSSDVFASGPPAAGDHGPKAGKIEGTTHTAEGDIETLAEGRGASAVSRQARPNPDQLDDSFAGEISEGEASGQDNA